MSDNQKPAIRFSEFTDAWEQRNIEDWGYFYYGHSAPKWSVTEDATTPCVRYGELYTKFGNKIDRVFSYTNIPPENLKFSKGTEVLVPRVGEDPMDYNHCTWLSLANVAIGEMISVYNTEQNPLFTAIMFNATLKDEFAKRVEGGSVTNLYYEKLLKIPVSFPQIEEQRKIGEYFDTLDHLITLHQRKYEKMVNVRKSMLERLFPQSLDAQPTIRFKKFSLPWHKVKLRDIVVPFSEPVGTPHTGYERLGIRSHGKGVFHEYVEAGNELDTAQMHRVEAHNLIVNITFAWEHAVAITTEEDAGKLVSHRFPQFFMTEAVCDRFLKYMILDPKFRHHLLLSSPGGAGRNRVLKVPEMLDYEMMIPDIKEQEVIADYLNSLDELIDLYGMQAEKLKNIKTACLQKMFI